MILGRRIEITALHRDGHEFPVELSVTPVPEDEGPGFVAFIPFFARYPYEVHILPRRHTTAVTQFNSAEPSQHTLDY